MKPEEKPVLLPGGELKQFFIKLSGETFRCYCGCNVFHKPDQTKPEIYQCNACERRYEGET